MIFMIDEKESKRLICILIRIDKRRNARATISDPREPEGIKRIPSLALFSGEYFLRSRRKTYRRTRQGFPWLPFDTHIQRLPAGSGTPAKPRRWQIDRRYRRGESAGVVVEGGEGVGTLRGHLAGQGDAGLCAGARFREV